MSTTMDQATVENLAGQIAAAEQELSALIAEEADLARRRREAAEQADAAALTALRARADDLPTLIATGQARLIRLEIAALARRLPELDAAH